MKPEQREVAHRFLFVPHVQIQNNMSNKQIFDFSFNGNLLSVRQQKDGLVFNAKQVCTILGMKNTAMALKALDDDEKGINNAYTLGGKQKMLFISESGLYHLIFISRKPQAKAFRRWVTSEVLPSIRRSGAYAKKAASQDKELFAAMKRFIAPADYREVAKAFGVSVGHVQNVASGHSRSFAIFQHLRDIAFSNRQQGIVFQAPQRVSAEQYRQLLIPFAPDSMKGGEK